MRIADEEVGAGVGLLDELEQQAQQRGIAGDEASRRKAARDTAYRTRLEPALDGLHAFLTELTHKLRTLHSRIALHYHVPGYGEIVGYIDHEYRLEDLKQPSSRDITLDFGCAIASDECPSVEVEGASRLRAVSGFFQRHRIGGMTAPRKDVSGDLVGATFRAKGRIPVSAHFHADAESGVLRMTFTHFDGFDTTVKSIAPAQVDEALYEQIGRYLVREPNTLLREDLPEAYRKQLRSKVQQQQIKRRWENRISDSRDAELSELRRAYSAAGKLGGLFGRVKSFGRIGGAIGQLRGLFRRRK
ncbi:MAG TPA: hypothetical protein VH375_06625 [Rhodanobacteraceae bacterium]